MIIDPAWAALIVELLALLCATVAIIATLKNEVRHVWLEVRRAHTRIDGVEKRLERRSTPRSETHEVAYRPA